MDETILGEGVHSTGNVEKLCISPHGFTAHKTNISIICRRTNLKCHKADLVYYQNTGAL